MTDAPNPPEPVEEPWLTRAELATVLQVLALLLVVVAGFLVFPALGVALAGAALFLVGHIIERES